MQNEIQIQQLNNKIKCLNDLINETIYEYNNEINEEKDYSKYLINILKKNNFWPALQVKKYKGIKNQILLHNTYIREDIEDFKELYEQCRSVILDFSNNNNNIVVSYSNSIPLRISKESYIYNTNDKLLEAYDGTTITAYYYNEKWHIGTTSCPDINSSWFSHPTKTHGMMLDEVLNKYSNYIYNEREVRQEFVKNLDKNTSYVFVLVHYENKHIVNYTNILGENYMELIHIDSKEMNSLKNINIENQPLANISIKYPKLFNKIEEANDYILNIDNNSYGYIVKRKGVDDTYSLAKVSSEYIKYREETDPCNPNPWYNLLSTYMKNRIDYHINDYIRDYSPIIEVIYDNNNREIDPTYLIHTSICTIKDIIFKLYIATTTYNNKKNIFKMNKEIDKQFSPLIRFHLAKLRRRQITVYIGTHISSRDIYYYLCHCIKPNDIKHILQLLTTSNGFEITERSMMCLVILTKLLN